MRKAGMTMKQIGKQLRQCAYIMQEELLHHAIFVFPLVVLVVLAHLVQAFTYHGALLPFHVVYYQQFLFWKLPGGSAFIKLPAFFTAMAAKATSSFSL